MEENERELIRTKLTELIKHTYCTPEFLTFFFGKKILTFDEIQEIAGIRVDSEKALKFYERIQTRTRAFAVLEEGLKKFNQTGAINVLVGREELNPEPTLEEVQHRIASLNFEQTTASQKRNISFNVTPPAVSFTGRTGELEQLHQMIFGSQDAERNAVVSQVTSVSGLGGIGKTQLAKEYVRINGKEFDGNVLWMNAESEESLAESFQRLSEEKLNLPTNDGNGRKKKAKCIAEAVYKYFEGVKALFVLDNAEKAPWLKEVMPRVGQAPTLFVLLTSREREWDRRMQVLQLDGLVEEEAVRLIQEELRIDLNDTFQMQDTRKLAQTLQCFPLALQQAIAYIYEQQMTLKYSIKDYLQEFERKQYQLLTFQGKDQLCSESFSATTAATWSVTVDKIKNDLDSGRLAKLILNVIAYLGADNIQRNLFYRIPSICTDIQFASVNEEQINEAVRLLVKYSMLSGSESQSVLSVHRLVQSVTRHQVARDEMEEMHLDVAFQLLQGDGKNDFLVENISHALIVWRHAFRYDQIIKRQSRQVHLILWKMREVGHQDEGVRFGNEALEKLKEVLGEDHLDYLWIQRNIGLILQDQGYFDDAILAFQDILTKAKSIYGEDSEIALVTKEGLGNSLRQSGKYKEALKILREVFEKRKKIFGDNDSRTLITEQNYGLALMESGNLAEAEKIFQRIIEIYIVKGDKNSTKVLQLQNSLSTIYSRKGDNEKALEIYRGIYKKLSPVWTENANLFAWVCSNLGISLNEVGKHEEALKILERNIEKIKKQLGSQHLRTLEIQQRIGRSYLGLGNLSKAHETFQSVHQAFVSLSGEDSLPSLSASEDIAVTLSLSGEHSKSLSKFQEILSKMEIWLGNENYYTVLISKWEYARAIERSGENLHTALELLKQAKAGMIPIVGQDAPNVEKITNDIKRIEKKIQTQNSVSKCLIA